LTSETILTEREGLDLFLRGGGKLCIDCGQGWRYRRKITSKFIFLDCCGTMGEGLVLLRPGHVGASKIVLFGDYGLLCLQTISGEGPKNTHDWSDDYYMPHELWCACFVVSAGDVLKDIASPMGILKVKLEFSHRFSFSCS